MSVMLAGLYLCARTNAVWAENYEDRELTSRNLILPEMEQYRLGAKLFKEKNKKIAAWKAFQTFLYNYPDSSVSADAQFMIAESIFAQATFDLQSGNPPDEMAWRRLKKSGGKRILKGLKNSIDGFKYIGSKVSGEPEPTKEPDRIDFATFSEAIEQYGVVAEDHKKSGLADTALFRIAECFYNMGDYPYALEYFRRVQKDYPNSYLAGEALLGAAQCYIPGGDFGSAELEIRKLVAGFPSYQSQPQVQFISGIIRFQEGKFSEALAALEKIDTPEAIYYSGQSLLKVGKSIAATAKFKKILEEHKTSQYAELSAYLIGESFFLSKNYPAAVQEYRKFLRLYPQSNFKEGVLYKIAASHFLNKDYPASRENFNLILNSYPNGEFAPLARYLTAESYRFAKQYKEASFSYGQLISQMPNAPITANGRFKLGWVTYLQQNYTGTVDAFQRYIDWHPFHAWVPNAYIIMGNANTLLGRTDEAANNYQQAFDRAPKTEVAEAAMALLNRTRYRQGNYGQLTTAYTYILKALPPSESKWRSISQLYLAESFYRQKLFKEAISIFQSIISLYPNHPATFQALDGLSWCYFQLGDTAQSIDTRKKIKDIKLPEGVSAPTMGSGSFELANALFNQKKYAEALESYEKFIKDSPNSKDIPDAVYRIGLCYYRQEYYTQAIQTWEEMEQKYPKHPRAEDAAYQVADTYFRAQKYDKAIETYRRLITQYPRNANIVEATLRIGQSYYNAGDDDKAVTEFENFLRKYPSDTRAVETLDLMEASMDRSEPAGGDARKQKGIALLRSLVDAFPQSTLAQECQFRIARRMFNWKDYANSAAEFDKLLEIYPESAHIAHAQFYAAESNYFLKKYAESIEELQRFLQNFPGSEFAALAWMHLATSQFNTGTFESAIVSYQSLLQSFSDSEYASAALYNLALAQKKIQKLTEAADSYLKFALNYPQDNYAKFAMLEVAKIKSELKQPGEAIQVLKDLDVKLAATDDLKPEVQYLIAENWLANNDTEEAMKSLRELADSAPQSSEWKMNALLKISEIYKQQEHWPELVQTYQEMLKINKDPQTSGSIKESIRYYQENYLGGAKPQPTPATPPKSKPKTTGGGQ